MPRGSDLSYVTFDRLQLSWLHRDMATLRDNAHLLDVYNRQFFAQIEERVSDANELGMNPLMTQKQFQHLKSLALDIRGGK